MAPTLDTFTLATVSIAFLAALSGSLHCVVMCGPIRLLSGNSFWQRTLYQGGRLFGYLLLGTFAGYLGFTVPFWILLPILLIGLALAFFPQLTIFKETRQKILRLCSAHPLLLGFSSALLPCGLLHAWVGVAAITSRPFSGAFVLFVLWLGSLPALELSTVVLSPLQKLRIKFPAISYALLFLAIAPIAWRYSIKPPTTKSEIVTCPMHAP